MTNENDGQQKIFGHVDLRQATAEERRLLGQQIRDLRRAKHLSQQDLANTSGVSRRTIGGIERGEVAGQGDTLSDLFAVLGHETRAIGYSDFTEQQLLIIAPLLDALPLGTRDVIAHEILLLLAQGVRGSNPPGDGQQN